MKAALFALFLAGCNVISYRETLPDGSTREASAWYCFTGSDAAVRLKKGDTEVEYNRRQRIAAETLNRAFDAIKALAEAAP